MKHNFKEIAAAALPHAAGLVARWLIDGDRQGSEWVAVNPKREDANPGSFKINLVSGAWADFATEDRGSDLISLAAFLFSLSQSEAAGYLAYAIGDKVSGIEPPAHLAEDFAPAGDGEPFVLIEDSTEGTFTPAECGPSDSFLRGSRFGRVPDGIWHYRNATSQIVLAVCRWNDGQKKTFLPASPWDDGTGNTVYRWKGMPGKRPLYDLPKLLDNPDASVLICEGEKAREAAESMLPKGWLSTCWAGGAQSVLKTDWTPLLGREVWIWPDADEAGRKAAKVIANQLPEACTFGDHAISACRKIKGKLPVGWDAADAIDEGLTAADLLKLFQRPSDNRLEILDAADMANTYLHEARPIIEGLLREGENANLIASTKTRKSFAALQLAMSVATGREWLGFQCHPGKVLLIDNELKKESITMRIRTVAAAIGITPEDLRGKFHVVSLRGKLRGLDDISKELVRYDAGEYDLVILDAMYRMYPKGHNENDNALATALYNTIDYTAERMKAAFVMVHHASKGIQSGKASVDVGSGAGAISRATDAHLTLLAHAEPGKVVLTASLRSWASPEPRVLSWDEAGRWVVDPTADPSRLAGSKEPGDTSAAVGCLIGLLKDTPTPVAVLKEGAKRRRVKWTDMEAALAQSEAEGRAFSWEEGRRRVWSLKPRPEKRPSKTDAVKDYLELHPETKTAEIAAQFGVDPSLVRAARKAACA